MKKMSLIIFLFLFINGCMISYLPYNKIHCDSCRALGVANRYYLKKLSKKSFIKKVTDYMETDSTYVFLFYNEMISQDSINKVITTGDEKTKIKVMNKYFQFGGGPHEIVISKRTCKVISHFFRY
jgi:hypothetical protein